MKPADIMQLVDPAMLDAVEAMVVQYLGHRRHETEAQTRAAIAADPAVAASHARKVRRAGAAGRRLRPARCSGDAEQAHRALRSLSCGS